MNSKDKIYLAIGSFVIITATGVGGYAIISGTKLLNNNSNNTEIVDQESATDSSSSNSSMVSDDTQTTTNSYEDGTYTASSDYSVPHGYQNKINVSITVKDGVITAASATHSYTDRESGMYIDSFDSSLSSAAVGKDLNSVSFSRIGGASLTTDGFTKAIEVVQVEASA